jgi:putative glutathione S-transferase
MIRYSYPVLHKYALPDWEIALVRADLCSSWLKGMYWNESAFKDTTDFRHIKENYTKSHYDINPHAITPVGPWPDIESGFEEDWSKLRIGKIDMPAVVDFEKTQLERL